MLRAPRQPAPRLPALPLTGERTVPGVVHENYWFARHVAAYAYAARHCRGRRVLDAGAGEGYGTALLARAGARATGVELAAEVVAHARAAYPGVPFLAADLCDLPLPDASVDVVVSLQVIEHLPDVGRYLAETARVLVPGGVFVCATPNRLTFTPGSDTPVNPFHVREFAPGELATVLGGHFALAELLGVVHGPRLRAVERLARRPLPELVLARPPDQWPGWLTRTVAAVRPRDFPLRRDGLERSLDLLAVARRRRHPPP